MTASTLSRPHMFPVQLFASFQEFQTIGSPIHFWQTFDSVFSVWPISQLLLILKSEHFILYLQMWTKYNSLGKHHKLPNDPFLLTPLNVPHSISPSQFFSFFYKITCLCFFSIIPSPKAVLLNGFVEVGDQIVYKLLNREKLSRICLFNMFLLSIIQYLFC